MQELHAWMSLAATVMCIAAFAVAYCCEKSQQQLAKIVRKELDAKQAMIHALQIDLDIIKQELRGCRKSYQTLDHRIGEVLVNNTHLTGLTQALQQVVDQHDVQLLNYRTTFGE